MKEVASYIRIVDAEPTNELVKNRAAAVKDIAGQLVKSKAPNDLLAVANSLVEATHNESNIPDRLATEVEAAIQKHAVAFVRDGKELEMLVCTLLGALQVFEEKRPHSDSVLIKDVLAIGLWTGLSFQQPRREPKLEELRGLVLARTQAYALAAGQEMRTRSKVQDLSLTGLTDFEDETLKSVVEEGLNPTIEALIHNAVIDREELDLLWWTLGGWSSTLARSLDQKEKGLAPASGIAAGLEVGKKLRGFPVEAHKHLVLRFVKGATKYSLPELLEALGEERAVLGESVGNYEMLRSNPSLFPLCEALRTGGVANHVNGSQKRSLADWSTRALVEVGSLHLAANAPKVLI